jgi:hypothetical protein
MGLCSRHFYVLQGLFFCYVSDMILPGKLTIHLIFLQKIKTFMNEEAKFKVALKSYLNTHAFYSVDEFLVSKIDSSS